MSTEHDQLKQKAEEIRLYLQGKRKEVEVLEREWIEANAKARDWQPGQMCQARSWGDGWRCCLDNTHDGQHETPSGYRFYNTR